MSIFTLPLQGQALFGPRNTGNRHLSSSSSTAPPKYLAGFEIKGILGAGFFSTVYLAKSRVSNLYAAIKIADPGEEEALKNEAKILSLVKGHPNIVEIYDYGHRARVHYLIMEFIKGAALEEILVDGPLAFARAVKILRGGLKGLEYLHKQGCVHGDVRTGNIMESENRETKLIDFGFAEKMSASSDQRTDIFSLGISFIDMLAGEKDLASGKSSTVDKKSIKENPVTRRLNYLPDTISGEALSFIKRIAGVDRTRPFSSCRAIEKALNDLPNCEI